MNIYEIAKLAGVSIATVSRVVNDSPLVSEKTKARVRRVMEENNYTPNVFARGLGLNSMQTIGIVCPDVADHYMARAVSCLERALRATGYDCILCCSGYEYAQRQHMVQSILRKRIDALILIGSSYAEDGPDSAKTDYIREAAGQVPVFVVNGYIRGANICCALCGDYEIVQATVAQMLRAGRRNILFLTNARSYSAVQKLRGYQEALRQAGIAVQNENILFLPNEIDTVQNALLARGGPPADGILATEDGLAAGALKYAKRMGLDVPRQLCIVGYNNSELAVCCDPELSTIDSRCDRLCEIVIDCFKRWQQNKPLPARVYAEGVLVRRGTTDF